MTHGARFRRGGVGCGWKGISIALTIRSLDRTYRMECDRDFLPAHCGDAVLKLGFFICENAMFFEA